MEGEWEEEEEEEEVEKDTQPRGPAIARNPRKASSVGANTVKGPAPSRAPPRSAAPTAASRVENSPPGYSLSTLGMLSASAPAVVVMVGAAAASPPAPIPNKRARLGRRAAQASNLGVSVSWARVPAVSARPHTSSSVRRGMMAMTLMLLL